MTSRVVLISLLFAGSVQITNAAPLDSPEIVYIDGTPCNRMCQSYMAWSRQVLSGSQAQIPPKAVEHRAAGISAARPKSAARDTSSFAARCVLLVDDVTTSGATLSEAAAVLRAARVSACACSTPRCASAPMQSVANTTGRPRS